MLTPQATCGTAAAMCMSEAAAMPDSATLQARLTCMPSFSQSSAACITPFKPPRPELARRLPQRFGSRFRPFGSQTNALFGLPPDDRTAFLDAAAARCILESWLALARGD